MPMPELPVLIADRALKKINHVIANRAPGDFHWPLRITHKKRSGRRAEMISRNVAERSLEMRSIKHSTFTRRGRETLRR
jgi:hypothetical protein